MNITYNYFFSASLVLFILLNTIQQFIPLQAMNNLFSIAKLIGPLLMISYLINHEVTPLTAFKAENKQVELNFDESFKVYFSFLWRFIIYAGIINAFINVMLFFVKNYAGALWNQLTNAINALNFTILNYEIIFTSMINNIFSIVVVYFVGKTIFETVILRVDFKNFKLKLIN